MFRSVTPASGENQSDLEKSCMRTSFAEAAREYDDWSILQRRTADSLLRRVERETGKSSRLLDLGTGTGYVLKSLGACVDHVVGLDIAFPMLVKARERSVAGLSLVCADAECLPLQAAFLDVVFSNLAIQWCQNLDGLFSELARVLKPGGRLYFTSFGPDTLHELREAWASVDEYSHVNRFYPESRVRRAMQDHGFTQMRFDTDVVRVEYPDVLHLLRELKGIGAHNVTRRRPRGLTGRKKFSRMLTAYDSIMNGGSRRATFEVYYVSAVAGSLQTESGENKIVAEI